MNRALLRDSGKGGESPPSRPSARVPEHLLRTLVKRENNIVNKFRKGWVRMSLVPHKTRKTGTIGPGDHHRTTARHPAVPRGPPPRAREANKRYLDTITTRDRDFERI